MMIPHECLHFTLNQKESSQYYQPCRNHNVNPRDYLNDVIARMPYMEKATHKELAEPLPHRWKPVDNISSLYKGGIITTTDKT
jgi:hypothetical protein